MEQECELAWRIRVRGEVFIEFYRVAKAAKGISEIFWISSPSKVSKVKCQSQAGKEILV
jgi:hypothetical protein